MNACTEYRHLLLLFVGDDLDPVQLTDVREHLRSCPACTAVTTGARRAREAYRAGAIATADEEVDLWPAIRARLREEAGEPVSAGPVASSWASADHAAVHGAEPGAQPRTQRGSVLRLVSGLAAAAVVVFLARPLFLGSPEAPGGASPLIGQGHVGQDRAELPTAGAATPETDHLAQSAPSARPLDVQLVSDHLGPRGLPVLEPSYRAADEATAPGPAPAATPAPGVLERMGPEDVSLREMAASQAHPLWIVPNRAADALPAHGQSTLSPPLQRVH